MSNDALPHNLDLGPFSRHLMANIVKLQVGPYKVSFNVHEDVLCKLRFFNAALTGRFREATEKIINMPDDDSEVVAKLIEFLYTGNYSDPQPSPYATISPPPSGPSSPEPRRARSPPHVRASSNVNSSFGTLLRNTASLVPEVPETHRGKAPVGSALYNKIFHAEVYGLADKYDCPDLMKLCFQKIDNCKLPDNDELLKYWAAIYDISGPESKLRIINRLDVLGVGASRSWVRSLWQNWPVEMQLVIEQYPEFARDMMVLLASRQAPDF